MFFILMAVIGKKLQSRIDFIKKVFHFIELMVYFFGFYVIMIVKYLEMER